MIDLTKYDAVLWQEEENGVPEMPIGVRAYSRTVGMHQADQYLSINRESLPELIKLLRMVQKGELE